MRNKLIKIFGKEKNIVIGAIHFAPLLGYQDFPGLKTIEKNALNDLKALEEGGVDGVIFENNYDVPHKIKVTPETVVSMLYLGEKIKSMTKLPVGISVLWNDYQTALAIAKILDLQFIRIPVFVDKVKTSYGIVAGTPKDVIDYRKFIGAENAAIFTDIHVKHSELISKYNLRQSARMAIESGSDALIITGNWTGESPNLNDLDVVRKAAGDFPVLIGSGVNKENIAVLFRYANGAIVSTSLKEEKGNVDKVNVKSWKSRINTKKVKDLVKGL